MGLSPPRALAGTAGRRYRWGLFLGTVLVIDSIGHAYGNLAKTEFFPDFGGIVQQFASQVNELRELSPFHKNPATPSGSQSDAVRTAYTSLPPEGVKERVADATTSAWGKLVIGPTDKGISIWRRAVPPSRAPSPLSSLFFSFRINLYEHAFLLRHCVRLDARAFA